MVQSDHPVAAVTPTEIKVSIEALPWRALRSATRWNGQAAQVTIGIASAGQNPLPAGEPGTGQHREHHRQIVRAGRRAPRRRPSRSSSDRAAAHRGRDLSGACCTGLRFVPGAAHRVAEVVVGHGVGGVDGGDPGGVVHRRPDAVDFVESGLDPGGAGPHVIPETASSTRRMRAASGSPTTDTVIVFLTRAQHPSVGCSPVRASSWSRYPGEAKHPGATGPDPRSSVVKPAFDRRQKSRNSWWS